MRFKKGSKVEVMSKKDVPSGAWHCAEIICGNGHNYTVRYDGCADTADGPVLERISRKAIRPCAPPLEDAEIWVPGDVVEVFDDFSWKMATISEVLGKNYFLVRLLGSVLEFEVSKFDIRARQSWQDDKWIVIGKGCGSRDDRKHNDNLTLKCDQNVRNHLWATKSRIRVHVKDDCLPVMNMEKTIASCKTLKRRPCGYSQVEEPDGVAQKFRAIEKKGRLHRVTVAQQSLLPEQVDAVYFPGEMQGEKFICCPKKYTQFFKMDAERRKPSGAVGCSLALDLESKGDDCVNSSVGSCSINSNNLYEMHHHAGFIEDTDGHSSDAESFCYLRYEEGNSLPIKDELAAEIRRLELHAYRCTMEALYASGPLSWEQEELVTNLRLSLHISNDEHLMEAKVEGLYTSLPKVDGYVGVLLPSLGLGNWKFIGHTHYDELQILLITRILLFQATFEPLISV